MTSLPEEERHLPLGPILIALGAVLGVAGLLFDGRLDAAHLVPLAVIAVVVVLTLVKALRRSRR